MSLPALREGLHLLVKHPVLWLSGGLAGILGAAYLYITFSAGLFIGSRAGIFITLAVPFLLAGVYRQVCDQNFTVEGFFLGGKAGYFRVLLPAIIVGCAALLTVLLVLLPLVLLGIPTGPGMTSWIFLGVFVPFVFFTFFFDTAAILEDQKVFDAIRRSASVVLAHGWRTFAYYIENLILVAVVSFVVLIGWTSVLFTRLESIARINMTDPAQALSFEQFQEILGPNGLLVTCAAAFILILVLFPVITAWKACYFRECTGLTPPAAVAQVGVYDEKGRWFKY